MGEPTSPFGRTVKQWRERQGMSRSELAEAAELSYPYVSQLETGLRKPSRDAARKLASALGISVEDLERTIPSDPQSARELRNAEAHSALILSGRAEAMHDMVAMGVPTPKPSAIPGSREDLVAEMIDLLEEFPAEERLDVLAEVQKTAMQRMLNQRHS